MSFDVNEIVSVCTLTGEFVGKFVVENADSYEIDDPRLLTPTQNGQYAFLPSVCCEVCTRSIQGISTGRIWVSLT